MTQELGSDPARTAPRAGPRASLGANALGAVFMIGAMACFAIEDAAIKAAARTLPVGQVLMLFGLGGAAVFALWARLAGARLLVAEAAAPAMLIRAVFEVTGRLFYVLAITLIPLSAATVILQATPLVVVAGAALLFGERVGWRRWLAILVGLAGVVIIVQPGANSFSWLSVLAVIGTLGFAGRDLASRAAPAALGSAQLGFYGFLAIIVAGAGYALWQGTPLVWPDAGAALWLGLSITAGVAAYTCLMRAMRTGEVSAVTPFRYTRLLFGVGLGVALFGETVTPAMGLGAGLIVLSGLFILWRGQR